MDPREIEQPRAPICRRNLWVNEPLPRTVQPRPGLDITTKPRKKRSHPCWPEWPAGPDTFNEVGRNGQLCPSRQVTPFLLDDSFPVLSKVGVCRSMPFVRSEVTFCYKTRHCENICFDFRGDGLRGHQRRRRQERSISIPGAGGSAGDSGRSPFPACF